MHGLIFATWEKYLAERFGTDLLNKYRKVIGETAATSPLTSRVYDDAHLLAGVGAASQLTHHSADVLLWEYGRYFMINGLTSHLCAYLLNQVSSGRELLLAMHHAHDQMRRTPDGITPPLFAYEALSADPHDLILIYESPRKLCSVLWGAIEGAAKRYGERVQIVESSCMKRGAPMCRFELRFSAPTSAPLTRLVTPEQIARRNEQQHLDNLVLTVLPDADGFTLGALQGTLRHYQVRSDQLRPSILLAALRQLQHVGLVASTANQPEDDLTRRRYWRAPTSTSKRM